MSNLRLTLVGSGPQQDLILSLIEESKNQDIITLLPWSDDVPTLLQEADIYALSSDYEGWARVLIEAMASGLPIVTTDVGCVGEVCKSGTHALVTPTRDTNAFAEALITLAKDKEMRQRFSTTSIQTTKSFQDDMSEYATDWVNILDQTV